MKILLLGKGGQVGKVMQGGAAELLMIDQQISARTRRDHQAFGADHIMIHVETGGSGDSRGRDKGDIGAQARYIFDKIGIALAAAGSCLADVVRTRIYVTDMSRWEAVGLAHGEVFKDVRPVSTLVEVSKLIDPRLLVEIEAEAVVPSRPL